MIKMDQWLLERVFEPLACEIESWTAINHWRVSRFMILLWVVADATWAIGKHDPSHYAILGLSMLGAGSVAGASLFWERMQRRGLTANFMKHDFGIAVIRSLQAILAVLSTVFVFSVSTIGTVAVALAWYFASCDRLPPKERRVFIPAPEASQNA